MGRKRVRNEVDWTGIHVKITTRDELNFQFKKWNRDNPTKKIKNVDEFIIKLLKSKNKK